VSSPQDTVGEKIRAARKAKGLSLDAAVERLGTTRRQLIRWEKGENVPGPSYRKKLAKLYGLDPDELTPSPDEALTPLYRAVEESVEALRREMREAREQGERTRRQLSELERLVRARLGPPEGEKTSDET